MSLNDANPNCTERNIPLRIVKVCALLMNAYYYEIYIKVLLTTFDAI